MFIHRYYKTFNSQPQPNIDRIYDEYFPPKLNQYDKSDSIFSKDRNGNRTSVSEYDLRREKLLEGTDKNIIWRRLSEIPAFNNFVLFPDDEIHASLFCQGRIGDCYFIDACSGLSNYGKILTNIFQTPERNDNGYYEIVLFIDGEFQIVYLDDYFPFYVKDVNIPNNNITPQMLAFAYPYKTTICFYFLLLEKAWAKINGGYSNIQRGLTSQVTPIICACQTERINHTNFDKAKFSLLDKLYQVSSGKDDHAYTMINVSDDEIVLRNPHGNNSSIDDPIKNLIRNKQEYYKTGKIRLLRDDYLNKSFYVDMDIAHLPFGKFIYYYYLNVENENYLNYLIGYSFFKLEIYALTKIDISVFTAETRFNRNLQGFGSFDITIYDNSQKEIINKYKIEELFLEKGTYLIKIKFNFNENSINYKDNELKEVILGESIRVNSTTRGKIMNLNYDISELKFENLLNGKNRNQLEKIYLNFCIKKLHKFTLMVYSIKELNLQYLESSNKNKIKKFFNPNYEIPEQSLKIERRFYIFHPDSKDLLELTKGVVNILKELDYELDMDSKGHLVQKISKISNNEVETILISKNRKYETKSIEYHKLDKLYIEYDENMKGNVDEKDGIISQVFDENGQRITKIIITDDIKLNREKIKNSIKMLQLPEHLKVVINNKNFHHKYSDIDLREEKKKKEEAEKIMNGLSLGKKIGGVGFEFKNNINNFNSLLYSEHFILFPCKGQSIELEIINIIKRIILPEIKINSIDQIWATILYELTSGFLIDKQIPYVSLDFNNEFLLYSCMHDFYKNTLVGHILFLLDYYMKGFLYGGFFKEDFIYNWEKNKNNNFSYLQNNFIDMKKYLYQQNLKNLDYDIFSISEDEYFFKNNMNALQGSIRIIGLLGNKLKNYKNIFFPDATYTIDGEMYVDPIVFNYKKEDYEKKISEFNKKLKIEKLLIYMSYEKIPYFKGYFFLLNLITFGLHYLPALISKGQFVDLSQSFHNQNKIYVRNLPKVLPRAPIVQTKIIKPEISFSKILKMLEPETYNNLKSEMNRFKKDQITLSEKLKNNIEKEINLKYRNYIITLVDDSEEINIRNNKDLKIELLMKNFFEIISDMNNHAKKCAELINQKLLELQESMNKEFKKFCNKNVYQNNFGKSFKNLEESKDNVNKLISFIDKNIKEYPFKQERYFKEKNENILMIEFNKMRTKIIGEISNKRKILYEESKSLFNQYYKSQNLFDFLNFIIKEINKFTLNKLDILDFYPDNYKSLYKNGYEYSLQYGIITISLNDNILNQLKNELINDINPINKEFEDLRKKCLIDQLEFSVKLDSLKKKFEVINVYYYSDPLVFSDYIYLNNNYNFEIKKSSFFYPKGKPKRNIGGALFEINNNIFVEECALDQNFIDEIKKLPKSKYFQGKGLLNPEKYIVFKTKITRGNFGIENLKKLIGRCNEEELSINPLYLNDEKNLENISKKFDLSIGHCKVLSRNPKVIDSITNEELNQKNKYGENPSLFAVLNNNEIAVEILLKRNISSNFENDNYNDATPLIYSLIMKNNKISKLLIDKLSSDCINSYTETHLTALHYAVLNNSTEIVKSLVDRNAKINMKTRYKGNTPFHIAAKNGYIDILNIFLEKIKNISSIKRKDKKNPLFTAVKNSLLSTKLILQKQKNIKDKLDNDNQNVLYYSLIYGRYDTYYLCKQKKFKLNLDANLNNQLIKALLTPFFEKCTNKYNNKNCICYFEYSPNLDYIIKDLCSLIKRKDTNNIKNIIENNFRYFKKMNNASILNYNLITSVILTKEIEYLHLISHILDLKYYPIAALVGKYGIFEWIPDLIKLDLDLFLPNPLDKKRTIINYAILSKNYFLIFKILEQVVDISNEHLSEIINKVILSNDKNLINLTIKYTSQKKYINKKISFKSLSENINSTPEMLEYAKKYIIGDLSTIDIEKAAQYCRPSFFNALLNDKDIINKIKIDQNRLIDISNKNNRYDNLKILYDKGAFEKYYNNGFNLYLRGYIKRETEETYKDLEDLENKLSTNNLWFMDRKILKSVNKVIEKDKFGLLPLPQSKLIFTHFLIEKGFLKYINFSKNLKLLIKNDDSKTAFESLSIKENFLKDVIKYYSKEDTNLKNNIRNLISIIDNFINALKILNSQNLGVNILEFIISYLFKEEDIIKDDFYFIANKRGKTLFHLISKYNDSDSDIIQKIISKYEHFKTKYSLEKLGILFSEQDIEGSTIIMNLIKSGQLTLAYKIINDLKDYINFLNYDIKGNTILHYLFLIKANKDLIKKGKLEIILNICLLILQNNSSLILDRNFSGYTPWLLAAKAGNTGALFLMSKFYNPEKIEEYSYNTSCIHEAATSNKKKIIRYLIEFFRYNINSRINIQKIENKNDIINSNITNINYIDIVPLHFAARSRSLESFKFLIEMGANPFIKNRENFDSISILLENCDEKTFNFIIKTRIFKASFYNGKYLFDLLTTSFGEKYILDFIKKNGFQITHISNKLNQNLFLVACKYDDIDIIMLLLQHNENIDIKDISDNTALHYLAANNSIKSGYFYFKYIKENFIIDRILDTIFAKNNQGNTPFHICCEHNTIDFLYILIEFTKQICNPKEIKFEKNNDGLTPLQLALYNKNYECAKLMYNIFNLNINHISLCSDLYRKVILNNFNENKNKITESNIEKEFQNFHSSELNIVEINFNNIITVEGGSTYDIFNKRVSKYYELKKCNKNIYLKYESIFCHPIFLEKLYTLAENGLGEIIDYFFEIINLKLDLNKAFHKLVKFYIGFIFVNSEFKDFPDILNNLEYVLFSYLKNLNKDNPIFDWILSMIISYYQYKENIYTYFILSLIKNFINRIKELNLVDALKFTNISDISFRFIYNLLIILKDMDQETAFIQIKRINMIPPLLITEIKELKSKYKIINCYSFSDYPLYKFCSKVSMNKNSSPSFIDSAIEFTNLIQKSDIINFESKTKIIELFHNNFYDKSDINLNNCFYYLENIILNIGNEIFINDIIPFIYKKDIPYKDIIDIISNLSLTDKDKLEKKVNFLKKNDMEKFYKLKNDSYYSKENIPEIIERFKTVNLFNTEKIYSLPKKDLEKLEEFGNLLKNVKKYTKNELKSKGLNFGKIFRESPTILNLLNLISVIISGFVEVMGVKPYLIQVLASVSFCLYFIDEDMKKKLKGRIAQIATGEGKTITIVILALITSLQGYFTDIITTNSYLAKYAHNKYKKLYDTFGITSSHIVDRSPNEFDAMVIYGINTDFEFTIMEDKLYLKNFMMTKRLGKKKKEKRKGEVVIVDEVDNLIIDQSLNWAIISYPSKIKYSWVYQPIYNYISSIDEKDIKIENLRKYFETYNKGEYFQKINRLDDNKIQNWINMCKLAIELKKNVDYVVKFAPRENKKKVFIIEKETGRISKTTRWNNSLHEFVETKENLSPENEMSWISNMSHYTFYNNHKFIFGLTGTIGTDAEKEEIKTMYKLDTYDVPTNFINKRKILENIMLISKDEKFQKIKNDVIKYSELKRPVLVIFKSIEETLEFSDILKQNNISHKLLNDIQIEDEDSIISYGRHPGNIIIATIVAGRGTDIVLNQDSIKNGGLHVIIGFLPENRRVEFQCVGRAGRQGQPGTSQMIFSKDEKMIKNAKEFYDKFNENDKLKFKDYINDEIKSIFYFREYNSNQSCFKRIFSIKKESYKSEVQSLFFEALEKLSDIFENNSYKLKIIDSKKYNHGRVKRTILDDFRIDWCTFYSQILDVDIQKIPPSEMFWKFLVQYEWEFVKNPNLEKFMDFVEAKYKKNSGFRIFRA